MGVGTSRGLLASLVVLKYLFIGGEHFSNGAQQIVLAAKKTVPRFYINSNTGIQ